MTIVSPSHGIKRILILGHSGFIGSCLEKYLRTHETYVEILGFSSSLIDLTNEKAVQQLTKFLDLNTAVVMCSTLKKEKGDSLDSYLQNLRMTTNLCHLLKEHPVKRFIYFSSTAVYGEDIHNPRISENTPVNPTSYYGIAKYNSECLFRKVIDLQKNSTLLVLRPPSIYGPEDKGESYGPVGFSKKIARGDPITLWGDGTEQREFIFIDDLIEITAKLLIKGHEGTINIVSGSSYTFKMVLDILSKLNMTPLKINSCPRSKNKADHGFENDTFKKAMPNYLFTPLDQGILKTFQALLSQ